MEPPNSGFKTDSFIAPGNPLTYEAIDCVFYPLYWGTYGVPWPGPNPLSDETLSGDLFHTAALVAGDKIEWIELRICGSNLRGTESGDQFAFFLSRTDSALSNLPRVRRQLREIIFKTLMHLRATQHLWLAIYLHREGSSFLPMDADSHWYSVSDRGVPLDPGWFVVNIAANFHRNNTH